MKIVEDYHDIIFTVLGDGSGKHVAWSPRTLSKDMVVLIDSNRDIKAVRFHGYYMPPSPFEYYRLSSVNMDHDIGNERNWWKTKVDLVFLSNYVFDRYTSRFVMIVQARIASLVETGTMSTEQLQVAGKKVESTTLTLSPHAAFTEVSNNRYIIGRSIKQPHIDVVWVVEVDRVAGVAPPTELSFDLTWFNTARPPAAKSDYVGMDLDVSCESPLDTVTKRSLLMY